MTECSFGIFSCIRSLKFIFVFSICIGIIYFWYTFDVQARNLLTFSDTVSNSAPLAYSNHTIKFTVMKDIPAGGYIDFTPPLGFNVVATSSFSARNVELLVNNVLRVSSSTGGTATDTVSITPGTPGKVRYTLNSTTGLSSGDVLKLIIGDNTSKSFNGEVSFSTTTGTTTASQDVGIINANATGSLPFILTVNDNFGNALAYAKFRIFLINAIGVGPVDTTENIPPVISNGAPFGDIGGTTLSIQMSVETDEFATCKYSTVASTTYAAMPNTFDSTGFSQIVHTNIFPSLANSTYYTYYIRCIDDEGNFNTVDYPISFHILNVPAGTPNTIGNVEGSGTGSGNSGTGSSQAGGSGTSNGSSGSSGGSSGGGGSGGGGGGGAGSNSSTGGGGGPESTNAPYRSGNATVIINGYAFPNSTVTTLVDGKISTTGKADSKGKFSITISRIARGVYTFGIYATDAKKVKSSTFSTSFSVQGARTSSLSNINVMPSILVTPDPVGVGKDVLISGFSIPNAKITIENQNDKSKASLKTYTATSSSNGAWSLSINTSGFTKGTYKVRAKAFQIVGVETGFSGYTYYGVGQKADIKITADLNKDGKVNLVDFSILLFWWGGDGGVSNPPADINRDGKVSLTDFSIMLFNWTG